jgi:hypothetical protein
VLDADEEGELRARLAAAAARLREAQFRQQQAQAGQGGADARPEDLAMAKAELETAVANLMALLHPLQEKVQQARSGVEAARADLRAAEGRRDACGEEKTHTVVKVEGQEEERETVTDPNCSDHRKEAAEAGIEVAARKRDIAEQQLQLLTNPAQPQILYVVAPLAEAATAAGAKLQKLATGGSRDQQTLDLAVAVAQS